MSKQPENEECADMFRVMMWEMMQMHPQYRALRRCSKELVGILHTPGRMTKEQKTRAFYLAHELKNLFGSFDE